MRDKIRIELSSESRLGWEPFYAVLDLPATAQQIRDARQKARITGREDMTYQSISFLGFDPLPDLEHIRLCLLYTSRLRRPRCRVRLQYQA